MKPGVVSVWVSLAAFALFSLALMDRVTPAGNPLVLHGVERVEAQPGWQVVHIVYRDQAALQRLAERLDVWEVHPEAHSVVARVSPMDYDWLLSQGYPVTVDSFRSQQAASPPGYDCYRTVSQLYADEDTLASTYPALTELFTIGASYEGRLLRVLKLANKNHVVLAGPKPRFFLMANIHGREFITPEVAMQFAKLLLNGYGRDADATWLLDWHEVYILVTANPDGHAHNEQAFTFWRKNANPIYQALCPGLYGTDLNRNSSFQWGTAGSSDQPCDEVYRGQSAASDLETQAIQTYVTSLFPDQREPSLASAAPLTATGVLITLHSYGNLVLWPWGFTSTPAPNDAQLAQLGHKLASYNGYVPQPAYALYLTSGTTDDWSYGTLGIASYTFEIGGNGDGFLPWCGSYEALVQPNLSALFYAARVARAPYLLSAGPDVLTPTITLADMIPDTAQLTATIVAANPIISTAQAYIDTPPWANGSPLPLFAADGAFDSSSEVVTTTLSTLGLDYGRHIVFVRGQDMADNWGPISAAFLFVLGPYKAYLPLVFR